ncbi:MAG: response regulator [Treponema sp.]|nr:response regulator [Treponema sp.]
MNSISNTNEWEWSRDAQLEVVMSVTIFSIALIVQIVLLSWEVWVIPFLVGEIILFWTLHVIDILPQKYKIALYSALILLELFYYGIHPTALFDTPMIIIICLALFLSMDTLYAIYICGLEYIVLVCWHSFVLKTVTFPMSSSDFSHLSAGAIAVALTVISKRNGCLRRIHAIAKNRSIVEKMADINRRTEDFLTNVTHELRTPINAVMGLTSSLLKTETDEQKRSELSAIQKAGHRLFNQIRDILDYSEIGLGKIKILHETYSMPLLVSEIKHEIQVLNQNPEVDFIFDVDIHLPTACVGDIEKIKTIIRHVLGNAVKFTTTGCIYVRLYAIQTSYGINLCVSVRDTGIGMTEEQKQNMDTLFYQGMSDRTRKAGGIGLGFTVVSGLIQVMNGFFRISSELDKGTEVHISIPQGVSDALPFLLDSTKEIRSKLCIAYHFSVYSNVLARPFYSQMIAHVSEGLREKVIGMRSLQEIQQLAQTYSLTHIFTTKIDFEKNRDLFLAIDKNIKIVVIGNGSLLGVQADNILFFPKPLDTPALIEVITGKNTVPTYNSPDDQFICPEVKVLSVDDDPMNLMVAKNIFNQYHMDVVEAHNGLEAIELCKKQNFDIVFLDHMMPEMDGVECLHHLRSLNTHAEKDMIVVALTANAVSGAREMFLNNGFDEFISKPLELPVLNRVLKKLLPVSKITYVTKAGVDGGTVLPVDASSEQKLDCLLRSLKKLDYVHSYDILKNLSSDELPDMSKVVEAVEQFDFEEIIPVVETALVSCRDNSRGI